LETEGVFVETEPVKEIIEGMDAVKKYKSVKGVYYEYVPRPLNESERIKQLEETVAMLMLGGTI